MNARFVIIMGALASVGAIALGAWAALSLIFPAQGPGASRWVDVTMGSVRLRLDPAYIRHQEDRSGGPMHELALDIHFPTLRPAGRTGSPRSGAASGVSESLIATLKPADPNLDPADRTAKLYARFLESDTWSHPGGLVMRRFTSKGPYAGEELYIAPPEGRQFAARCMRPRQSHDGLPDTCIADVRVETLDVNIRFAPELLVDWEALTRGVQGLVLSMRR